MTLCEGKQSTRFKTNSEQHTHTPGHYKMNKPNKTTTEAITINQELDPSETSQMKNILNINETRGERKIASVASDDLHVQTESI